MIRQCICNLHTIRIHGHVSRSYETNEDIFHVLNTFSMHWSLSFVFSYRSSASVQHFPFEYSWQFDSENTDHEVYESAWAKQRKKCWSSVFFFSSTFIVQIFTFTWNKIEFRLNEIFMAIFALDGSRLSPTRLLLHRSELQSLLVSLIGHETFAVLVRVVVPSDTNSSTRGRNMKFDSINRYCPSMIFFTAKKIEIFSATKKKRKNVDEKAEDDVFFHYKQEKHFSLFMIDWHHIENCFERMPWTMVTMNRMQLTKWPWSVDAWTTRIWTI